MRVLPRSAAWCRSVQPPSRAPFLSSGPGARARSRLAPACVLESTALTASTLSPGSARRHAARHASSPSPTACGASAAMLL